MTLDLLPILSAVIAYVLGCIPSSWILVRFSAGKDVRMEGTGNMGAMNSYEVSGKRWVGIIVTAMDALKGIAAIQCALWLGGGFFSVAMAGVFSVLGHCFNVFFRFHGGRGLATAAGVCLAVNPLGLGLWLLMYLTGFYIIRRDVHVGSVSAILGVSILMYTAPSLLIQQTMVVAGADVGQYKSMVWMISFIMFVRHIQPMRELFVRMQQETEDET